MTIYKASQIFRIPKQTLNDRKNGKVLFPQNTGSGRQPVFEKNDEQKLVNHITYLATLGYGYSRTEIVKLATDYSHSLGILPADKSFSLGWLKRFFRRWPTLKVMRPRSTELYRAKCATPAALQRYFSELKKVMDKYDLHDKPQCIYNVDETGINTEHKPGNVVALKGSRPAAVTSSRSATVTVIACGNAAGSCIPPFVIFKGKRNQSELAAKCTAGTQVRMSDTGWSNNVLFMDFLENHFLKHTSGGDPSHKLLLYDGHASHVTIAMIEWARDHKVILFVLPPHTSHLTQPLDVGCFGPFKRHLYAECGTFMRTHVTDVITKYDLGELVCKVYPRAISAQNLISCFKKTGIFPFNADSIDNSQLSISSVFTGESPASRPTDGDTNDFFKDRDPMNKVDNTKKHKETDQSVKIGGTAISESPIFHQLKQLPRFIRSSEPVPSTSRHAGNKNKVRPRPTHTETSSDNGDTDCDSIADEEKCCVCGLFEPAQLKQLACIQLVNWAQCDGCGHWVHLKFCVAQHVVRCHTQFLCPHCQQRNED